MKKTYAVISHTHWDREWYQPFELFRYRLVDMMDNLLKIMKDYKDYRFHLDAQTIVLEDYLEIRPEKRKIIEKYVKEGRILIGPWYVQNDFNLTSGEATVRNLIIGQKIADDFGKCTRVAYMADQFGLTSQLPQIFVQSGMDTCIFGRGANDPKLPPHFYWRGADGSVLLCEFMRWWYNNLQRLPDDKTEAAKLIKMKAELMSPIMKTSNSLLMNGVDHLEAQENLLPILDAVRSDMPDDVELIQDTMPEFLERTKAEIKEKGISLPEVSGELRIGGEGRVLTGTLSSRIYLKIANVRAQVALEKRVEPLYALLSSFKITDYPIGYIDYLWKLLIKNHPHDSICGCSVDPVHRHMMDRYERIAENTDELIRRGMQSISDHVDKKNLTEKDFVLTVLNTVSFEGKTVIDAEVMIPDTENVSCFKLISPTGKEIPFVLYAISRKGHTSISPINLPGNVWVTRYRIRFTLPLDGIGYKALTVRPCEGTLSVQGCESAKPDVLENKFLRCKINKNGTLTVTDKRTKKIYDGLMLIEDSEECGDEYIHRESKDAPVFYSDKAAADVSVIEDNKLMQRRKVTLSMNINRDGEKTVPFNIELSLNTESPVIDVKMSFNNTAKDHRVRVLFPTGIKSDGVYAAAPFDCVKHALYENDGDRRRPNSGYIAVTDGNDGLAILNEGLYEYEHKNDEKSTLALTVLRSTDNFLCGVGGTSWGRDPGKIAKEWLSPEAECLGENEVHFGICPFAEGIEKGNIFALTELFLAPAITHSAPVDMRKMLSGRPFVQSTDIGGCVFYREPENADKKLPCDLKFAKIIGDGGKTVISACKRAENGKGTVVRLFNPTENTVDLTLVLSKKPRAVDALSTDERITLISALPYDGKNISLTAKPKEIITLFIK